MNFTPVRCCALGGLLALAGSLPLAVWAQAVVETRPAEQVISAEPEGVFPLDDLRMFTQVFEQIRRSYVDRIDDKTLFENAVRGMLSELDPHSAYLDARAFTDLKDATSGEFGGLGIEVSLEGDTIKIVTPLDDTPAARAGIQAGDVIVKINDTAVKGLTLDRATDLLRGEIGEPVTLTLLQENKSKPRQVTLIREMIKLRSVKSLALPQGVTYLRISQFQADTVNELKRAFSSGKNAQPNNALILDLRNNPGGILQSAVDVADLFLSDGLIVYTRGRLPDSNMRYQARPNNELGSMPVVVLINEGSASAAEILAGALQDQQRAKIIGQTSFGKGSVQTVLPIGEDKAIKLTTALYYTPSGRSIQANGISPDIEVTDTRAKVASGVEANVVINEASLSKHLPAANETKKPRSKEKATSDTKIAALDMDELLADPYVQAAYKALAL